MKLIPTLSLAAVLAVSLQGIAVRAADPDFGPNVLIFDPSMADIAQKTKAISDQQVDEESAQFTTGRYAFLFKPGTYPDLDIAVGYYMQVLGLGQTPDAVTFTGKGPRSSHYGNVTQTFWRAVENLAVDNKTEYYWGVSQGTALRRVHVKLKLNLFGGGWASGGFNADCKIDNNVSLGGQQQWFSRNSECPKWGSAVWNMVFVGNPNAPTKWPTATAIPKTPTIAEKPYLYIDDQGNYFVMVPALRTDSDGDRLGWQRKNGRKIHFD